MHWWMVPLATMSGLVVLAPAICRHLRRRWVVVVRVWAELAWFYQPRSPRERFTPGSGKRASTVVVLRRSGGTALATPR
ncbi:hypothetical protein [Saccharopolyspora spinosa]|uniref:Uncharacterized protein n=1 Tax=Saccharopolyspora spinosa TaxID=60894 RepID=A0A2N3XT30_SACSN|nr:hypothetical protein [Saccharopolyspora spinosa]PKW13848.1 hypothetical protein A8926_1415 [Saccharopolyspora spinosa]